MTSIAVPRPRYYSANLHAGEMTAEPVGPDDRWDLWLLGPYFGLRQPAVSSLHTATVPIAYKELDAAMPATPFQLHTPQGLRRIVASLLRRPALAAPNPADLPRRLWTSRWEHLVDSCRVPEALTMEQRLRLGVLLCALGLDRQAVKVLPDVPVSVHAQVAMKRSHARWRAEGSAGAKAADQAVLASVATSTDVQVRTGLAAALTLVVNHARGPRPAVGAVAMWRRVASHWLTTLRPERSWLDRLSASTYWRAVSFHPFLLGDHDRTRAELDQAELFARSLPTDTDQQDLVRRQNLHPLLETRTRAARAAGDLPAAIGYAQELAELDPYDGKVFLSLGDVLAAAGNSAGALASYRSAARLGLPHAPRAHLAAAECLERLGAEHEALDSYLRALRIDPACWSAAEPIARLAARLRRQEVHLWCIAWMQAARQRLRDEAESDQ